MNDIYVKGIYGEMLRYLLNIFIGFKDIHECKINLVSYESYIWLLDRDVPIDGLFNKEFQFLAMQ